MKVLVIGMTSNFGGIEAVIMNYYKKIDSNIITFDFLCFSEEKMAFADYVKKNHSRVFYLPSQKYFLRYNVKMRFFFKHNIGIYDAIWVNLNEIHNLSTLKYAKKYDIPIRILHAHNSQNIYGTGLGGKIREILHNLNKGKVEKLATDFFACSEGASKYFYPSKLQHQVKIISNAIEIEKYTYHNAKRVEIRKKLALDQELLIGNVGRLHFQKNQKFLIDVFRCIYNKNKNARLVLVGQGPDEEILKKKVKEIGLEEYVFFAGVQTDIQAWLSAMDVFCFPSLFEGLGVVALEVQANGLPIISSKTVIPSQVKVLDNFEFYPLNRTPEEWAEKILTMDRKRIDEEIIRSCFERTEFNIKNEARKFEKMLLERYKREKR